MESVFIPPRISRFTTLRLAVSRYSVPNLGGACGNGSLQGCKYTWYANVFQLLCLPIVCRVSKCSLTPEGTNSYDVVLLHKLHL